MTSRILLEGTGLLFERFSELLSGQFNLTIQNEDQASPQGIDIAIVLHDYWQPSHYQKAEKKFRSAGIPWLRGFVSFGEGIIGPFVFPDKPGCSNCADLRRIIAGPDQKEMYELYEKKALEKGAGIDAWASQFGLSQMAYLLLLEIKKFCEEKSSNLTEQILILNLKSLKTDRHSFLPEPLCPFCGSIPEDTYELAQIELKSSLKQDGNGYRCRSLDDFKTVLVNDYLDERTGVMNDKLQDSSLPFADVIVNMPLFGADEGVAGRSHSYEISELTAILEGLERNCGIEPRGKKRTVRSSFRNLKDLALNPERVGLHELEQYKKANFPFQPYTPDRMLNWVWGYSFLQERPILVPELLAYYSIGSKEGFVYETSNGCALGSSLEEAIFHGIMEVIERDSFLLSWYARLPLRRLDLDSAFDLELKLMVERVREAAGYDLYFYNSTMEHGIPSVWAIAKNREKKGMNIICAAGANPDPIRAVKAAIFELAGMMHRHDEKLKRQSQKYLRMLEHSFDVKTMEDHGILYGLKEAEPRLGFLLNSNCRMRTFDEEFTQPPKNNDLKDDLVDILVRFNKLNLEVIVVDQSTPLTKRNGLSCVKVVIPGMLPMTFGHHLTRVRGLERVLNVPVKLGYREQPLTVEQLNPYPHPFP